MNDGVELLLRAAGALVALGGLAVLYLLVAERFSERVLAAFGATSERHETLRRLALSGVALLAFAAGLALAALHAATPALMLAAAIAQAGWRLAVKKYLPEGDAAAVNGREAARLTLMLFLGLTAVVLGVDWQAPDLWRPRGGEWLVVVVAAVAALTAAGHWLGARRDGGGDGEPGDGDAD